MGEFSTHLPDNVREFRSSPEVITTDSLTESPSREAKFTSPAAEGPIVSIEILRRDRDIANAITNMRRDRIAGDSIYERLKIAQEDGEI